MRTHSQIKKPATATPQQATTSAMSKIQQHPVAESDEVFPETRQEEAGFHTDGYSFANVRVSANTPRVIQQKPGLTLKADKQPIQTKQKIGESRNTVKQETSPTISGGNTGMPEEVQAKMESAFNTNFSELKVHANSQKASDIGALAYTKSNDIHFAPGLYQPNNKAGQELLGHELVHIVQQRQGRVKPTTQAKGLPINDDAGLEKEADKIGKDVAIGKSVNVANVGSEIQSKASIIQRAVGFEFQTNWQVYKRGIFGKKSDYPKKTPLYDGTDWTMETDGNEIEFVVKEIQESSDGEAKLTTVMDHLILFVEKMNKLYSQQKIHPPQEFLQKNDWLLEISTCQPNVRGSKISANPQATVGVRMGSIRRFFEALTVSERSSLYLDGSIQYALLASQAAQRARHGIPDWPYKPSHRLQGLVTLIALYLAMGGKETGPSLQVAKSMAFIMSRTDFATMFSKIPESKYFASSPDKWLDYICRCVMERQVKPERLVIDKPINDYGNLPHEQRVMIPITVSEWLIAMTKGKDLLTEKAHPINSRANNANIWRDSDKNLGHRLRGLGGLGAKMDVVGKRRVRGAILEIRSVKKNMPPEQWKDFALKLYDFMSKINNNKSLLR